MYTRAELVINMGLIKDKILFAIVASFFLSGVLFFGAKTAIAATSSSEPAVTVTAPNGEEILQDGGIYRITWNASENIDAVMAGYTYGPGDLNWITTTGPVPNTGYLDWSIQTGSAIDRQAKIVVYGLINSYVSAQDESDGLFTILKAPAPTPVPLSITVTSPNGGETLQAGQYYRITWSNTSNVDKVEIIADGISSGFTQVVNEIPNKGYYDWNVGLASAKRDQVKIEVIGFATGIGNASDESDNYFTVQYPTPTPTPDSGNNGYNNGYNNNYNNGFNNNYNNGYNNDLNNHYNNGFNNGYNNGYTL